MANYKTHRDIGIISSILITMLIITSIKIISTYLEYIGINNQIIFLKNIAIHLKQAEINIETIIMMIIFGIIGSLFPDIDLKTSSPSKFLKVIVTFVSIIILINLIIIYKENIIKYINEYNIHYIQGINTHTIYTIISIIAIGIGVFISNILIKFKESSMVHRGVIHSLQFAILSAILIYEIINHINNYFHNYNIEINSILISITFFTGFITHLILDEIYSVDFRNKKIKKSFGTALKIFDKKNKYGSILLWIIIILYIIR